MALETATTHLDVVDNMQYRKFCPSDFGSLDIPVRKNVCGLSNIFLNEDSFC